MGYMGHPQNVYIGQNQIQYQPTNHIVHAYYPQPIKELSYCPQTKTMPPPPQPQFYHLQHPQQHQQPEFFL